MNSGGSFGASPLRREIGIGAAAKIDAVEIKWHGRGKIQTFSNIACNQFVKIKEGSDVIEKLPSKSFSFRFAPTGMLACPPQIAMTKK